MVGWKKMFRRSRSRGPLDQKSDIEEYDALIASTTDAQKGDPYGGVCSKTTEKHQGDQDSLSMDILDYYYPDMDKNSANEALRECSVGTFLLRKSQSPDAKYTLSVRSERHVFNVRIFYRLNDDGGYHLDAPKPLRKYFPSISALLRYYSKAPKELIALCPSDGADGRTTFKLQHPLSRSENAINLVAVANDGRNSQSQPSERSVTRHGNGGSLKAMVKWL